MASFTLTVNVPTSGSRDIELFWAQRGAALALEQARGGGGQVTSGTMLADGAIAIGTWSYTPTAPS